MNSTKFDFVTYQIALDMKLIGFNELCFGGYYSNQNNVNLWFFKEAKNSDRDERVKDGFATAPTYSQAFRWFREKYNAHHSISRVPQGALDADAKNNNVLKKYVWYISKDSLNPSIPKNENDKEDTYEEAELACLQKLIEIIKKSNE